MLPKLTIRLYGIILLVAVSMFSLFPVFMNNTLADVQSGQVRKILSELKKSGLYQFDFPERKKGSPPEEQSRASKEKPVKETRQKEQPVSIPEGAPLDKISVPPGFQYILWIILAAILAYLLLPFLSRLMSKPSQILSDEEVPQKHAVSSGDRTASEAEARALELASKGDFTEAVHYLWLEILQDLQTRRISRIKPADTGRDIIRILRKKNDGAFTESVELLLKAVELTWFGGRQIQADQYHSCYEAYNRLKSQMNSTANQETSG